MTQDWIEWKGGDCPVERGTLVDVRHRDGEEFLQVPAEKDGSFAQDWSWEDDLTGTLAAYDIIAYRVVL